MIEVDLTSLLNRFTFSPAPSPNANEKREIVWHMNHVATPAVKVTNTVTGKVEEILSALPLKVGPAPLDD